MTWGAWLLAGKLKSYDCSTCKGDKPRLRGCQERAPKVLFRTDEFGPIDRCPITLIPEWVKKVCRIYSDCRTQVYTQEEKPRLLGFKVNGFLPGAGGVMDQAPGLMRAFRILDQKTAEACK